MKTPNRGIILSAAVAVGLVTGTSYVWSIFRNPLMQAHGWDANEVTLAYSLFMLFVLVGSIAVGPLLRKIKPSLVVFIGGLLQGIGFLLTGFIGELFLLYLCYSFLAGFGNGLLYNGAIVTATRWFPDRKGMANGLTVGAMGLAPLLFAPVGNAFISLFDVFTSFKLMGLIMIVVFSIVAWFIKAPAEGWTPKGWVPSTTVNVSTRNYNLGQMLKTPLFYVSWLMVVCAICAASMMTSNASPIAQQMVGITPEQGALMVGLFALISFCGRFILAALSDKLGRFNTILVAMILIAADMLFFFTRADSFVTFLVVMGVVGFCFGGIMAMLPGYVSDIYGQKNFATNYPFIYSGFTTSSFIGPLIVSGFLVSTGNYDGAFLAAGIMTCAGIVLVLIARALDKGMRKKADAGS